MTKAAKIMALHAQGLTTREIALEVYGEATASRKAYVRIVKGQRKDGTGTTEAQMRYLAKPDKRKLIDQARARWERNKYATDPTFREGRLNRHRQRYATDPVFRQRALRRSQLAYARKQAARKQLPSASESVLQ